MAASTDLTRDERRLRAQLAANTRWSTPGAREAHGDKIRLARLARLAHYEHQVDPNQVLPVDERTRLAAQRLRADMQRLAFKSAKARRARKAVPDETT
jgi:hypothetical protein